MFSCADRIKTKLEGSNFRKFCLASQSNCSGEYSDTRIYLTYLFTKYILKKKVSVSKHQILIFKMNM